MFLKKQTHSRVRSVAQEWSTQALAAYSDVAAALKQAEKPDAEKRSAIVFGRTMD